MDIVVYLLLAVILIVYSYIVFRFVVARDYLNYGHLNWKASALQFLIFIAFFCFPYLYMPPEWSWDWLPNGTWNRIVAMVLVLLGMVLSFGTMIWFGISRAFGVKVEGIIKSGPYRYSRNPQMLGGWLMVLGVFIYLPSWNNIGWVLIWGVISYWMVSVEEEHLSRKFDEEYEHYCEETPRYLLR